jgi:hypothetical protein
LKRAIADEEQDLARVREAAAQRHGNWIKSRDAVGIGSSPVVSLDFETVEDGKTPNAADADAPAAVASDIEQVEGRTRLGIHFSGENSVTMKSAGDFERTDPFTISAWIKPGEHGKDQMVIWHRSMASMDAASRGYELLYDHGHLVASLVHFWPGNAIRVRTKMAIRAGSWTHVTVTYDGSSRAEGLRIYLDCYPAEVEVVRDRLYNTIKYEDDPPPLTIGARFRDPGFKDGSLDEFRVYDACLTPLEVGLLSPWFDGVHHEPEMIEYYIERVDEAYAQAREKLHAARVAEAEFAESLRQVMVMREYDTPPRAHVLARGAYDAPREEVTPDAPASVLPFPADYPRNRLGLAQWLVRPDHPLTSRVAVNRLWTHFFGRGLVDTLEDFGSQGRLPSHPELLDYLAATFMESGWDVKGLCRLIVTSATYMQNSTPDAALTDRDPANELLARGPRNRLSAEETRDAALAASGLLTQAIGGPSVKPYQPEGLWEEASSVTFTPDTGDKLYRRSMYTYIKRTVPPPMMLTFDATNREMCVAQREVTETPLQALVLLNDPQFVEAARVLAAKVLVENGGEPAPAIEEAFLRLIGRPASLKEQGLLQRAYQEQLEFFEGNDAAATAYTSVGEFPPDDTPNKTDLSAMTAVVQLLMNYDEFQVKS